MGCRLLVPVEDLSLAPELALTGTYDPAFIAFLSRSLQRGMTFVDVGANVGLFSIVAGTLVGPGGRVYAYECNPDLLKLLNDNVAMNWLSESVVIVDKAASHSSGVAEFWAPPRFKGLGSTLARSQHEAQSSDVQRLEVRTERLDARLADAHFIDLIKVDVEGAEADVLDGASALFESSRVGMLSIEFRQDTLTPASRVQMETRLTDLHKRLRATFHVPNSARPIPLDEVLMSCNYSQLLVRFPGSSIAP